MLLDGIGELNWIAIIVATVIYYAIGAVWYLPQTFGNAYVQSFALESSDERLRMTPISIVVPLVAYLVLSVAVALIAQALGTTGIVDGIVLGLVLGIGFGVTLGAITAVFDPIKPKPWQWFWVTALHNLVAITVIGTLLTVWQ